MQFEMIKVSFHLNTNLKQQFKWDKWQHYRCFNLQKKTL